MASAERRLGRFLVCAAMSLTGCYDGAPPPDVAKGVDLARFQGKWYEIAKLPRPTEVECTGTVATYRMRGDGQLDMNSECHLHALDGELKTVTANLKVPDPKTPAKLALDIGGFYGDYWILEVGSDYEYAVIGHPSREYLWVLSRAPTLAPATMTAVLERAKAQQFAVERLEYTVQAPGN
ncbi:MAG TPA: lipocalin family protein [Polyangiaceae bacterium]|nr:lipocalin family protein [Polyangiaceae bacterium]